MRHDIFQEGDGCRGDDDDGVNATLRGHLLLDGRNFARYTCVDRRAYRSGIVSDHLPNLHVVTYGNRGLAGGTDVLTHRNVHFFRQCDRSDRTCGSVLTMVDMDTLQMFLN